MRLQQIGNIVLSVWTPKIRRFSEISQRHLSILFQAIPEFEIVTYIVVAAGHNLLDKLFCQANYFAHSVRGISKSLRNKQLQAVIGFVVSVSRSDSIVSCYLIEILFAISLAEMATVCK